MPQIRIQVERNVAKEFWTLKKRMEFGDFLPEN